MANPRQREQPLETGPQGQSVPEGQIDKVKKYILNQEEHHRKRTFQEELIEMLQLAGIEYDERYLW